jgi:hypothetical protein
LRRRARIGKQRDLGTEMVLMESILENHRKELLKSRVFVTQKKRNFFSHRLHPVISVLSSCPPSRKNKGAYRKRIDAIFDGDATVGFSTLKSVRFGRGRHDNRNGEMATAATLKYRST